MMSYEDIRQKAGTSGSLQFEYNALVSAIPESWKIETNNHNTEVIIPREINTELGPLSKLSNKTIGSFFDKQKNHDICADNFWRHKLNVNLQDLFSIAHECTKETRLRLLQFKFIHNIYPTNILLNKFFLVTTNNCLWCSEVDYIEHAFYQCAKLKEFWENIKHQILIKYNRHVAIDEKVVLFGASKTEIEDAEIRKKVNHIIR